MHPSWTGAVALAAGLFSTTASAQATTTLSLPMPMVSFQRRIQASIVKADATATEYAFACASKEDCDFKDKLVYTHGPSTLEYHHKETLPFLAASTSMELTVDETCTVTATVAVCSRQLKFPEPVNTAVVDPRLTKPEITTIPVTSYNVRQLVRVTVTAGLEKLGGGGGNGTEPTPAGTVPTSAGSSSAGASGDQVPVQTTPAKAGGSKVMGRMAFAGAVAIGVVLGL